MKREALNIDLAMTYGWNRVAYSVLRSLASKGLNVAVGDVSDMAMAKKSKFCSVPFSYPQFHENPRKFVESLKSTFKKLKPQVYLPLHEEIFIIAKYIDEFNGLDVKIPIADFKSLRSVHKKDSICGIAEKLNIPAPKTVKPKKLSDLKNIWNDLKGNSEKVVVKTINSNSSKGIFYAKSFETLEKVCNKVIERGSLSLKEYPIIQEYVNGDGYGVSMLYNHGKLRAKFTHKRLREKIASGGTSTKRISVKNPAIEEYAEHLLSSLKWHGIAMVEFKFNENTNKSWLIEVNPRFWGSLALPIQAGVDFPFLLYKMAVDGDVDPVLDYKEGVVMRWILGDILATLSYVKAKKSLKPIIDFLSFKNEKFDDLYADDLTPFFTQCAYYLSKFVRTASLNPTEDALLDVDKI